MAGHIPNHPESRRPGPQMMPATVQLYKFPLTSLTMLAWRQRHNPKALMLDSASLQSHEKQTNCPTSRLPPTPCCPHKTNKQNPAEGNRSKSQQSSSICTFLGKCINRDRKRQISKKSDAVRCNTCGIKKVQKVDFELFRS